MIHLMMKPCIARTHSEKFVSAASSLILAEVEKWEEEDELPT